MVWGFTHRGYAYIREDILENMPGPVLAILNGDYNVAIWTLEITTLLRFLWWIRNCDALFGVEK